MTQSEEYYNLLRKANIVLVISLINMVPTASCIIGAVYMYIKEHLDYIYPLAMAGFLLCNVGVFLTFIGENYLQKARALG